MHYRCDWNVVDELRKALDERDHFHEKEHIEHTGIDYPSHLLVLKTLLRAGWRAIWDSLKYALNFTRAHQKADEYYAQHGKMARNVNKTDT